jgi:branched-chain amino acid transport system substrate-binding protein
MTGDAAVYGSAIRDGIELAAAEDGRDARPHIRLVYDDDRGNPRDAVSAVRRLIDVNHVPAIIGGAMSSTAESTLPVADQAQVVLLSPTATKPDLVGRSSYFFRLWPSDNYDGSVMAQAAYRQLRLRRVAILYVNVAYGVGITDVFARNFQQLGGQIVSRDGYAQGQTDFRTLLTRIAAQRPDAIYIPGYVAEVGNILRQARELNLQIRFIGVNSFYDPQLLEIAGPAAEGAVFTYPTFDVASADPAVRNFVSAFRARYHRDPDAFAAQGYDAYRVMRLGLGRASGTSGSAIRDGLRAIGRYSGPGGSFQFSPNGDVEKPLRLMTVRGGRFVEFAR